MKQNVNSVMTFFILCVSTLPEQGDRSQGESSMMANPVHWCENMRAYVPCY